MAPAGAGPQRQQDSAARRPRFRGKEWPQICPGRKLFEQLQSILAEEFEIEAESIHPDANLYEDLGIDSIDAVDLIVRLREITGKKVPPEEFKEVRTVGDVVRVIENL